MYFDNSALRVHMNADFEPLQLVKRGMLSSPQIATVIQKHDSSSDANHRVVNNRLHAQRVQEVCQLQRDDLRVIISDDDVKAAESAISSNIVEDKLNMLDAIAMTSKVSPQASEDPVRGIVPEFRTAIMAKYIMQTTLLGEKLSHGNQSAEISDAPRGPFVNAIFDQYEKYQQDSQSAIADLHTAIQKLFELNSELKMQCEDHYDGIRVLLINFTARLLLICRRSKLDSVFNRVSIFIGWHDRCMSSCFESCTMRKDKTLELPVNWLDTFDCFIFDKQMTATIESQFASAFPFLARSSNSKSLADTGFTRKMFLDHVTKHALSLATDGQPLPVKAIINPATVGPAETTVWLKKAIKKAIKSIKVRSLTASQQAAESAQREWNATIAAIPPMPIASDNGPEVKVTFGVIDTDLMIIYRLAEQVRKSVHGIIARVRAMSVRFVHVMFIELRSPLTIVLVFIRSLLIISRRRHLPHRLHLPYRCARAQMVIRGVSFHLPRSWRANSRRMPRCM